MYNRLHMIGCYVVTNDYGHYFKQSGIVSCPCWKNKPYQGSSVGSQQTRHTLQVKHIARSSPGLFG